jgi:hypothetical protein
MRSTDGASHSASEQAVLTTSIAPKSRSRGPFPRLKGSRPAQSRKTPPGPDLPREIFRSRRSPTRTRSQPSAHRPGTRGAAATGAEATSRREEEAPHGSGAREAGEEVGEDEPRGESAEPPPTIHGREEQPGRQSRTRDGRSRFWIVWGKQRDAPRRRRPPWGGLLRRWRGLRAR